MLITPQEIKEKISERAKRQFFSDMNYIRSALEEHNGELNILEVVHLTNESKKQAGQTKKLPFGFTKTKAQLQDAEDNYIYSFLLEFMAKFEMESLTLDEFMELPFNKLYTQFYKKQYEEYQTLMFNTHDAKFFTGDYPIIKGGLWRGGEFEEELQNQ